LLSSRSHLVRSDTKDHCGKVVATTAEPVYFEIDPKEADAGLLRCVPGIGASHDAY